MVQPPVEEYACMLSRKLKLSTSHMKGNLCSVFISTMCR